MVENTPPNGKHGASLDDLARRSFLKTGAAGALSIPFVTGASAQVTSITPGQTYWVENVHSGKALDVSGISQDNGATVHQWDYVGGDNQHWTVDEVSPGVYTLTANHSNKVLEVTGGNTANAADVQQWDYAGHAHQQWRIENAGGDEFRLVANHSEQAADVADWSTANGANVLQWPSHDGANQRWRFHPVDGGGGGGGGGGGDGDLDDYPNLDGNSWNLAWNDEFDQGSLDTGIWNFEVGGGCGEGQRHATDCSWGNEEEQYYTNGDNAWVENDRLVIEAREETAPNGMNPYTSARLNTSGTFHQQYGRIDVRARLPETQGLWPAIWMLGENFDTVGWPDSGEIDIMELTGDDPYTVHGTVHGPGYSGGGGITASHGGPNFANGFHDFQITWYPDAINWFVDGNHFHTVTQAEVEAAGNEWVFDQGFYLILNVAVGGLLPGYPDASTQLPQRMEVEHVRVYDQA